MTRVFRFTLIASMMLLMSGAVFAGSKPVLAVAEFQNETHVGWWSSEVARDLAGMLTNELASTEKFKLVERSKLDAVLTEQDLAESGRIKPGTGAKVGKLTGAQYIVLANVTAFEESVTGTGAGLSYRGIGIGGKKEEAYIAVDLRVVDATSGEVEYSRTIEARSGGMGVNLSAYRGGFGGSLSSFDRTPGGKAIRGMVMEISEYLACVMVDQDGCEDEYAAKEKSRREKTKKSIKLD